MEINMEINNKAGKFSAKAVYDGMTVVVKKGGFVNNNFAESIRGGKLSKQYRADRNFVSESNDILKDCIFWSPSTAAQFVTGRSVSGYNAWIVEGGKTLGEFLKEKGLR